MSCLASALNLGPVRLLEGFLSDFRREKNPRGVLEGLAVLHVDEAADNGARVLAKGRVSGVHVRQDLKVVLMAKSPPLARTASDRTRPLPCHLEPYPKEQQAAVPRVVLAEDVPRWRDACSLSGPLPLCPPGSGGLYSGPCPSPPAP